MFTSLKYSEELKNEVKALYSDYPKILELAERNSPYLKDYLCNSYFFAIPNDRVLTALSLEELQNEARLNKRKDRLFKMCYDEIQRYRENEMNDQN